MGFKALKRVQTKDLNKRFIIPETEMKAPELYVPGRKPVGAVRARNEYGKVVMLPFGNTSKVYNRDDNITLYGSAAISKNQLNLNIGSTDYAEVSSTEEYYSPTKTNKQGFTILLHLIAGSLPDSNARIISAKDAWNHYEGWEFGINSTSDTTYFLIYQDNGLTTFTGSGGLRTQGTEKFIVIARYWVTGDKSNFAVWENGQKLGETGAVNYNGRANGIFLGRYTPTASNYYKGIINTFGFLPYALSEAGAQNI
ncbi:MAG: hypothetical protein KJO59_07165, partial [Ignavibacteria bacterium]|nr:hypothetical protein [Ignavibacteria bacterium]